MITYFANHGPNHYHFALNCSRHRRLKDALSACSGKRGWVIIRAEDGPEWNRAGKRSVAAASDGFWRFQAEQFCQRVNERTMK